MVVNMVETAFDIALDHPWVGKGVPFTVRPLPGFRCRADMLQRPMATPSGPEAIRYMKERGFKERLDDLLYCTRDYTVFHGWDGSR